MSSEFYILYINLPCAHYAGDVTIIQYIVYSMLIGPIYSEYRTLVLCPRMWYSPCRLGLYHILGHKLRPYILYIGPISILYISYFTIYIPVCIKAMSRAVQSRARHVKKEALKFYAYAYRTILAEIYCKHCRRIFKK